eukprot:scaffold46566_cov35-Phaeocystis_antarctica.AAC.3
MSVNHVSKSQLLRFHDSSLRSAVAWRACCTLPQSSTKQPIPSGREPLSLANSRLRMEKRRSASSVVRPAVRVAVEAGHVRLQPAELLGAVEGHDQVGEPKVASRRDHLGRDGEARQAALPVDHVGLDGEWEDCLGPLLALAPGGVDGKALPVAAALVIALVHGGGPRCGGLKLELQGSGAVVAP